MRSMFNLILRQGRGLVKSNLTNNCPGLKLVFKDGQIPLIKRLKGWKSDSEMAAESH